MPENWDGIISQKINRKFSRPIAAFLSRYRSVTPNQMTIISSFIGFLSPLFFIFNNPILGGIVAQISSTLDGVDGELARLRKMKTAYGGYLDSVLDRYVDFAVIVGMTYYSFIIEGTELVFLIGLFALSGSILVSYTAAKGDLAFKKPFTEGMRAYMASRDVRIFLIFIGSFFTLVSNNAIFITLIVLSILTHFVVILRFFK